MEKDNQIRSKKRVSEHGEVFTNDNEVNAMLDLVDNECNNIESTFLEPACGNGNFLSKILERKLNVVKHKFSKNIDDFTKYSLIAISSLYGVELLEDNVKECIERLYKIYCSFYQSVLNEPIGDDISKTCLFILRKNILCGDALTLKQSNGQPIIFSEWKLVSGDMLKRRDYRLDNILEAEQEQVSLFWIANGWEYDKELNKYIPAPIKEYPLCNYKEVSKYE